MRIPLAGGPAEAVMDVTGHPVILTGTDPTNSVGGYPSFRCPAHAGNCVLAESGENQIVFTAFDPVQGRKSELAKVAIDPDVANWDLSPDGDPGRGFLFDYKSWRAADRSAQRRNSAEVVCHAMDGTGCDCLGGRRQEPVSGQLFFARNLDCAHRLSQANLN